MLLDDIFEVVNGVASSELEISPDRKEGYVAYVRPASTHQRTFAGFVKIDEAGRKNVFPPQTLFVSTDGEGSHSFAYVSRVDFVANSNVSILLPKREMSLSEKLFYANCITLNRWKFSYGRKPKGSRLKAILLPKAPKWLAGIDIDLIEEELTKSLKSNNVNTKKITTKLTAIGSETTKVQDLFDVIYGSNMELVNLEKTADLKAVNFVSRTSKNNGVSAKVARIEGVNPINGPVLTVAGGGSVLETFLQLEPFYSGRDLFYLKPKVKLTKEEMLFYAMCIRANKHLYSYGRQANKTLKDIAIPALSAIPKWVYGAEREMVMEAGKLIAHD